MRTSSSIPAEADGPAFLVQLPSPPYSWAKYDRVTVATITFNRLELTKRLLASLDRFTRMPFDLLVVDNASTDGTREFIDALQAGRPDVRLVANTRNVGKGRALLQIRELVHDGLLVFFDNDVEILSNYWLVHVLKAFHAARLAYGHYRVALGVRMLNCEEYGFRYAAEREVLPISAEDNDEPRTSFAARSKDDPARERRLDEHVVVGWTSHLMGGAFACPAAVFEQVRLEDAYPKAIGGVDTFTSGEFLRLGVKMGYIENGPIARHNDWPYTDEKVERYLQASRERMVTDRHYLRWKLRDLGARWLRRSAVR